MTRILADSLGGGSKTCIIATVAPSRRCLEETLGTLKYASKAMKITNAPVVNKAISPTLQVKDLEAEVLFLRQKLLSLYSEETHPSSINRLLREIQAEKDRLHGAKDDQRLAVECALREAHAASESRLDSIATRLLLAARERTKENGRLREELALRTAKVDSLQAQLDSLADVCKGSMGSLGSKLSSDSAPEELVPIIDKLDAEIEFHKGSTCGIVMKLKTDLDLILRKLDSHFKTTFEVLRSQAHLTGRLRQRRISPTARQSLRS